MRYLVKLAFRRHSLAAARSPTISQIRAADSKPEREFEETLEKAGAMFKAVEMAEAM